MELTDMEITEIAGELELGMICYIHKKTKEIVSIIDFDSFFEEENGWEEEINKVEKDRDSFIEIRKMPSRAAFEIMVDYTNEVQDEKVKNRLISALNRRKPFQAFKYEVDSYEEVRQAWFTFKTASYQEWVRQYLEAEE